MAQLRGGPPINLASTGVAASIFGFIAAVGPALGDDLKGYSIEATHNTDVIPGAVVAGTMSKHGLNTMQHHDRIYISVRGNVFSYSDTSIGNFAAHGGDETQLDKAKTVSRDRMQAWTVEANRLLRIFHEIEGTMVVTYVVDAGRATCTISYGSSPDTKTGRMVLETLGGVSVEVKGINIGPVTCTVHKGNVFAADQ